MTRGQSLAEEEEEEQEEETRVVWTVRWSPMTAETVQAKHLWQLILDKTLSHPRQDFWIPDNPDSVLMLDEGASIQREIQPVLTQSLKVNEVNPNLGA